MTNFITIEVISMKELKDKDEVYTSMTNTYKTK